MAYRFGSSVLDNGFSSLQEGSFLLSRDIKSLVASMNEQTAQLEEILARFTSYEEETQIDHSRSERNRATPLFLSRFSGNDPEPWIDQGTRYFDSQSISDSDRLVISSFYLHGAAAKWFESLHHRFRLTLWHAFTFALVKQFGSCDLENPRRISELQQTSGFEMDVQQPILVSSENQSVHYSCVVDDPLNPNSMTPPFGDFIGASEGFHDVFQCKNELISQIFPGLDSTVAVPDLILADIGISPTLNGFTVNGISEIQNNEDVDVLVIQK